MIDELIRKELEEMLEALEEFEQVRNEYDGLKTREKELNEIIEQTGVFTGKTIKVEYPTPIKEQKFNLFQRLFSKKYKEYMRAKEEYHAKCAIAEETEKRLWKEREEEHESAKAELEQVRSGIAKCEEFINSTDWQSMRQKQLDLADKEKAVQILIAENPELAKNIEFMRESVGVDVSLVRYSQIEDKQFYIEVLEMVKKDEKLKEQFETHAYRYEGNFEDYISKIQKELIEPKKVEEGKYKIPTKYLIETIRRGLGETSLARIDKYYYCDGKIPRERGELIQNMYEDREQYLLMHGIFGEREGERVARKICLEGLRCSTSSEPCVNKLMRTTVGTHEEDIVFLDFLEVCREDIEKVNKMLIQIPRKIIDEKGPVWAADVSEVNYEKGEVGYLPPQYIVGFISNKDGSFVENPVPMEQRKKYKYHFRDGETKACDVLEKELI